jgi:ribonucleoside-diphosphate reductase alpha chain
MVIVDTDHPDIEDFIDWKVIEEQKVAALVTGSKLCAKHLNLIMAACREPGIEDPFDPKQNPALKREIRAARAVLISENYVQRVIQFARQGYETIDFRTYDTDWDSEAYLTVAGQNSNNTVRITNDFLEAVEQGADWNLIRRTDDKVAKTVPARALWDRIAYAAWASFSSTRRSTTGTPAPRAAGSTPRTRARSTCSSTTRRAISPRST